MKNFLLSAIFAALFSQCLAAKVATVSPGTFFEQEQVELYDSVGAIVYQFKRPQWYDQFKLFLGYPCNTDKYSEDPLCPVFYYMYRILLNDLDSALEISSFNLPEDRMDITFDCTQLTQHFKTFKIDQTNMNDYLDILRKCTQNR